MPASDEKDEVTESVTLQVTVPESLKKWVPLLIAAMAGGGLSNFGLDQLGFTDTVCQERVDHLEQEFDEFKTNQLEHWRTVNATLDRIAATHDGVPE